jgi:hypothetical protein
MIFTISVIIFAAFIFMNLLPIYSNHTAVRNAVNDGLDKSNLRAITNIGFLRNLRVQMLMDDADDLTDWGDLVKVQREKNLVTVKFNYQRAVPLFENISLPFKFDDSIQRPVE